MGGFSYEISDGDGKIEGSPLGDNIFGMEGWSSGVSNKGASVARVIISVGMLVMGADALVTVRVVIAERPLTRGADVVAGTEVAVAAGYSNLRSGVRSSGASGEESGLVGVEVGLG